MEEPKGLISSEALQALIASTRALGPELTIASSVAKRIGEANAALLRQVSVTMPPFPRIEIPALKVDYSSLFPDLFSFNRHLSAQLRPALDAIQALHREQFADLYKNIQTALQAGLPPNWRGLKLPAVVVLEAMLLDEGLALAWVPDRRVLVRLLAASSTQERRTIVGRSWKGTVSSCRSLLGGLDDRSLQRHAKYALDSLDALEQGNAAASQALSANLLDSILHAEFDGPDRRTITGQQSRFDIAGHPVRVAIVLGGIWGAHGEYWPSQGDRIPRKFSRHASAHGVSRRQYSRVNAVISIMHVTSLLRVLQSDFR